MKSWKHSFSVLCLVGLTLVGEFLIPACIAAVIPAGESARVRSGKKWQDMDYGPFLSASIEAPHPRTNIAFKGIAIPLARAFPGEQNEAVVFDTDLLRYSAAWTGGFVALKGVVFDGEHWAYPAISGELAFGNPSLPGWGRGQNFRDPRPFIYGPLPREWAHWKGLYLHGQKVILSYTVGSARILEMPGLESAEGLTAFTRALDLIPGGDELVVQLAYDGERSSQLLELQRLTQIAAGEPPANGSLALLVPRRPPASSPAAMDSRLAVGLIDRWNFDSPQGTEPVVRGVAGGSLQLARPHWVPGQSGQALELDGTGYGDLAINEKVEFLATDLAIAGWINTRHDGTVLAQTAPSGPWVRDGKTLFVRGGRLAFDIGWVGAIESQRRVDDGRWHHFALVWSHREGATTMYVDGASDAKGVLKPKGPTRDHVFRLGFTAPNFPATTYYKGRIDDLRLYRRKLAEDEVRFLAGQSGDARVLAAGVRGAPAGARWITGEAGHLRLLLPVTPAPARLKVFLARIPQEGIPHFARLVQASVAPEALEPLTHGGPSRWSPALSTGGQLGQESGPYAVDTLTWPEENPWDSWMRFGGFDFFNDASRAAISTWNGDVWVVSGIDAQLRQLNWRRFATGLYQPLGLKIVDDQVYVLGRDQITRLHDLNGDGEADYYENFNNDTQNTEHFHEFALDLQTDAAGDFYYMKGGRHARDALHPQHGTLIRVSKDGTRSEIVAKGFRAPNGLEISPTGAFYSTDQEGYWMPANRLNLIKPGGFYGNVWSWFPDGKPTNAEPPICWIHPRIDRSPSTMTWVTSDRWGFPKNSLLSLSYGVGRIFLVLPETVNGVTQGGITPLPLECDTGIMRTRFHPADGQLYVCGLFGWAGNKTRPGGFYRVRYTGKPLRLPAGLHVATNGVVIDFTDPLDPAAAVDVGNYAVEAWDYRWTENYGSPDFKANGDKGRDRLRVELVQLAPDRKRIFLRLTGIRPVMQMHIQMNLKTADGAPLQTFVHHTIHSLGDRSGESWVGAPTAAATSKEQPRLQQEKPGLILTVSSRSNADAMVIDNRRSRLVALSVPAGTAPTPFLPPGRFLASWRGYLKIEMNAAYSFHGVGSGRMALRINGEDVLAPGELSATARASRPVQLRSGLNPIELSCESLPDGAASLRLYWSNQEVPIESVPPTVLVHEATDEALLLGEHRRLGRQLFATRHCARCHVPAIPFPPGSMPELTAEPPSLDLAGSRFRTEWLSLWMQQPRQSLSDATMPACLATSAAEAGMQARDVAAYLATLTDPAATGASVSAASAETIKAGEAKFSSLGCVACHTLPGDERLEGDVRRTLAHVRAKWVPAALGRFLRAPGKYYPWTRMPDFQLTEAEADSLAAYVISRGDPPGSNVVLVAGNAQRGQEQFLALGCRNCHAVSTAKEPGRAVRFEALVGRRWESGCLASDAARRGVAPNYSFSRQEIDALRAFVAQDAASLSRDAWPEFAHRQVNALRCAACHQLEDEKDFWFAVESREAAKKPAAANPFDDDEAQVKTIHRSRPPLLFAGEKLRPEWVERLLLGKLSYKPRPKLEARMPAFPAYARGLALGFALDHGCGVDSTENDPVKPDLAQIGSQLARKGALGCVDCHAVGAEPALAGADTATINFAHIPDRLRREYYDRYVWDPPRLLPGTMMPRFANEAGLTGITTILGGDARQQFNALWHFMRTVPSAAESSASRGEEDRLTK